jgi:hypothetical protein
MLPKFLIGDNTDFPDDIFIVHTEYPRFVYNLESEDVEWFDAIEESEKDEATEEVVKLIEAAEAFYQRELDRYEAFEGEE